jgi:hypothetical protein
MIHYDPDDGRPLEIVLAEDRDLRICFLTSDGQIANARLLASAPELLDALHGMIGMVQLIAPTLHGSQRIGVEQNHRLEAAHAAIRKATGEAA